MAARDVYTMKEFLEVISLQEQAVFLDIKRQQRAVAAGGAASSSSSVCSLEEVLDVMALQQKKATFEKKRQEKLAQPNVRRPTVIELFGELHYSEPLTVEDDAAPPVTFSAGDNSGSRPGEERGSEEAAGGTNHGGPRPAGGRNVGGGSNRRG